jgi:hypothetical protein
MAMGLGRFTGVVLALTAVAGCENDPTGLSDAPIPVEWFVERQELPHVDRVSVVELRSYRGAVFGVWFGEKIRCYGNHIGPPPMCPPWFVFGVWAGERIGWLYGGSPGGLISEDTRIDFATVEPDLYSERFWSAFRSADEVNYQQAFKSALLEDSDVPIEVLRRIAHELGSWISPALVSALLEHERARSDCEVLQAVRQVAIGRVDIFAAELVEVEARLSEGCTT